MLTPPIFPLMTDHMFYKKYLKMHPFFLDDYHRISCGCGSDGSLHDGILWLPPYPGVTPELIGSVPDVLLLRFGLSYFKH